MGDDPSNLPRVSLRLGAINGLRGAAIIAVVYFHVICGMWPADRVPVWLSPLVTNGWTGVNLFFILSGLVLYLPYAAGARSMATIADRTSFYRRRFLRLMPLFYLAVIVEWGVAGRYGRTGLTDLVIVLSGAFTLNARYFGPAFNSALWSIGVEIAFSAVFPFIVIAAGRLGLGRVLSAALALALAARLAGISRFPALESPTFNSDMILCRIDEFVIGMMLGRLYVEDRLPRRAAACAIAGAILVLAAWIGFDQVLRGSLPPIGRAPLNDVLDAGLFLIVCAALAPQSGLGAALSWRPLQVVGMMCYSLYIWHLPILDLLMPHRTAMLGADFAGSLAVALAAVLAIAALSYRFIEFGRVADWRKLFLLDPPKAAAPV